MVAITISGGSKPSAGYIFTCFFSQYSVLRTQYFYCTSVDWPRKPVLPGQAGTIKVTILLKVAGKFTKAATIYSNAKQPEQSFKFFGTVEAPAPVKDGSTGEKW